MNARYEIYVRTTPDSSGILHKSYYDKYDAIAEANDCVRRRYAEARVFDTQHGEIVMIAREGKDTVYAR